MIPAMLSQNDNFLNCALSMALMPKRYHVIYNGKTFTKVLVIVGHTVCS